MNNRSRLLALLVLPLLAALPGCASISKDECLTANWEDVGIRDGANGQPEEYLIQHTKACAKVGVTPARDPWLRGRDRGLERYCTPYHGYQIGEYGGGFHTGICANYDEDRFIAAFERGREVNRLAGVITTVDSEIREIRNALSAKDLEAKQRERLAYRLGQLEYERADAQRDYENARAQARNF